MGSNTKAHAPIPPEIGDTILAIRRFVRMLRTWDVTTERSTGLSSAQLLVLQLLADAEANSMNDLAGRTMTDQSSVSVVVGRLESKGLVSRTQSASDARRTTVSITPLGRDALDGAPLNLQSRLVSALHQLPPETLRTLREELTQVVTLMEYPHEPPNFFFEHDATTGSS